MFDHNYVKKLDGPNVKKGKNKMDLAEQVRADIQEFGRVRAPSRLVTIWCASTETFIEQTAAHQSLKAFEKAMKQNDENDPALDDLCLCVADGGRAVRQRRARTSPWTFR